jgi:TolB-like protein/Flp pilus assembly protein TadD
MAGASQIAYRFANFLLVTADKQLLRDGKPVPLTPKVYETLLLLLESGGRLVEKEEFLKRLWPDSFVEEVALAHNISQLRKALGNGAAGVRLIETVPKRGYRFLANVEEVSGPRDKAARVTLAVLPFENLGAGPEQDYLADGLTEELIIALGQIDPDHLGVIGRTSTMSYKHTSKTLAEIGRELGAEFLVESSLRGEAGRLRITSKLIRARDQNAIWSAGYDGRPDSVLEFQRKLSLAIGQEIRLRLSPERLTALERRQTHSVEAYDLYLRGRYFFNLLSPQTTRRAVDYFTRATQLDPEYALAWSGLADSYSASPINGDAPPLQVWPRAREAAARAFAAATDLAESHTSLALVDFWLNWDWPAAETSFQKAVGLDPSNVLAHRTLGILLSVLGRHDEARSALRRARELDPLHPAHHALSGQGAFFARDYAAAVQFSRQATAVDPEFWVGYYQLAQSCEQLGEYDLALEALNQAGRFSGGNSKVISLRGYVLTRQGRTDAAREVLRTLEAVSRERYVPPYATALVHAGIGERDLALNWLERAYDAHDVHLILLPADPKWDSFREDARFRALVFRCGFSGKPTPTHGPASAETT